MRTTYSRELFSMMACRLTLLAPLIGPERIKTAFLAPAGADSNTENSLTARALLRTLIPPFQWRLQGENIISVVTTNMFWRTYHSAEGVSIKTTALLHFLLTSPQKWELKSVTDMPLVCNDKPGEGGYWLRLEK